ncbi:hypothetical protein Tco_0238369 [Tanacetum coccineum]
MLVGSEKYCRIQRQHGEGGGVVGGGVVGGGEGCCGLYGSGGGSGLTGVNSVCGGLTGGGDGFSGFIASDGGGGHGG